MDVLHAGTAANVNKEHNRLLLLVYWQFANQLGAYRHLVYWTVYMGAVRDNRTVRESSLYSPELDV